MNAPQVAQLIRPWAHNPKVQKVIYPILVGLFLIIIWQGLVTGLNLPPYLVPSPLLMMKTLFTDWAALGLALWVTVKITLFAFAVATVLGVLISFVFVQSKSIEAAFFPYAVLLQVTPIVAIAPHHHLGQRSHFVDGNLRLAGGLVPHHQQHHTGPSQCRARFAKLFQIEPRQPLASFVASAHPQCVAVFLWRSAHFQRPVLDWRRGGRICCRHWRYGCWLGLSNFASWFSAQYPSHVCITAPDFIDWRLSVPLHVLAVSQGFGWMARQ
jgi:hypothetical protein